MTDALMSDEELRTIVTRSMPTVQAALDQALNTYRKQHGGPRPNSGGKRAGAGRKPKAARQRGLRPWVPVATEAEAAAIMALAPDERRARLLAAPAPRRPGAPTEGDNNEE